jgi:putative endonuclease
MKKYYIYMMTNTYNTVLYTGVTNNLVKRVYEHKTKLLAGFTSKYNCNKLVWYEQTESIQSAIKKEKQIKKWKREFKNNVINDMNPCWIDLYEQFI